MSSRWLASRWLEEASRWLEEECATMRRNRIHLEVQHQQQALELWHGGGVDSLGRMRMNDENGPARIYIPPETDRATCRTTSCDKVGPVAR